MDNINIGTGNVTIIISFKKDLPNIIKILPRTTLFLFLFNFINNKIKIFYETQKNSNIILLHDNMQIRWNYIIGVIHDVFHDNCLELICNFEIDGKLDFPIDNCNFMTQQILKYGLASIHKSTKSFLNLSVDDVSNYNNFCMLEIFNSEKQQKFFSLVKKIYEKNNNEINIPLLFRNNNNLLYCLIKYDNNNNGDNKEEKEETLYEIIKKTNFDIENNILMINGIQLDNLKNVPIGYALHNLVSTDFYIHIIYHPK